MREWQNLSHVKWYCRYHIVFWPEISKEGNFRDVAKRYRKDFETVVRSRRSGIGRRARDDGSCALMFEHSAEV